MRRKRAGYLSILLMIFAGCSSFQISATPKPVIPTTINQMEINTVNPTATILPTRVFSQPTASYASVTNYNDLVKKSKWIVIGRVVEPLEVFNGSRQPSAPSKPTKDAFDIAQVYKIAVEKYLKGSGNQEIYTAIYEGYLPNPAPSSAEIEQVQSIRSDYSIKVNTRYVMFFTTCCGPTGDDVPKRDYYGGILQPWLFEITANEECVVRSPWQFATTYFHPLKLVDLMKRIENPSAYATPDIPAYPAPGEPQG
jgi:hypothetical protein